MQVVVSFKKFQLHHTGIKTKYINASCCIIQKFQLHHTGIKTL